MNNSLAWVFAVSYVGYLGAREHTHHTARQLATPTTTTHNTRPWRRNTTYVEPWRTTLVVSPRRRGLATLRDISAQPSARRTREYQLACNPSIIFNAICNILTHCRNFPIFYGDMDKSPCHLHHRLYLATRDSPVACARENTWVSAVIVSIIYFSSVMNQTLTSKILSRFPPQADWSASLDPILVYLGHKGVAGSPRAGEHVSIPGVWFNGLFDFRSWI